MHLNNSKWILSNQSLFNFASTVSFFSFSLQPTAKNTNRGKFFSNWFGFWSPGNLWGGHFAESFLTVFEIFQGIYNVAIVAEIWHEVVSFWSVWIVLRIPEVAKLLLSNLNALLGVEHFVVGAEVRNEIVSWWIAGWWFWIPDMIQLFLSQIGTLLGRSDVVILTELWHEVVTWIWIGHWFTEHIGVQDFFTNNFLSITKTNFNIFHISVCAKVWNKVVLWRSIVSWRWWPREQWLSVQIGAAALLQKSKNC